MQRLTARSASGVVCVLALVTSFATYGQQSSTPAATPPAGREMPRPEELEPGVDTSKSPPPSAPGEKGEARAATAPPPVAPSAAPAAATTPAAAGSASAASKTPAKSESANTNAGKNTKGKAGPDRLELGATDVRGNSELPTVMYVVPWKRSDLGDLVGKPANSLVDEVLQPLDRDVFRRENRYYEAVNPEQAAAKSDAVQGSGAKP